MTPVSPAPEPADFDTHCRQPGNQWILRQRRSWYKLYEEGKLSLEGLLDKAPLIALAVQKARLNQAAPDPHPPADPAP